MIVTQNECNDTSECFTVTTTGWDENTSGQNIRIYPDPNDGSFSIDLGRVCPRADVTITGIDGRLIMKERYLSSRKLDMKISSSPGVYFVIITMDNRREVLKMVKSTKR